MNRHILKLVEEYPYIILYGMGTYGRRCFFDLDQLSGRLLLAETRITDKKAFKNHKIHRLDELEYLANDSIVVVSVSEKLKHDMVSYAISCGFKNICDIDIYLNDYEYMSNWQNLDLKKEIAQWYEVYTGRSVNIDAPQSYNEKIQWLKIYDSTPIKKRLSDKYDVRGYVNGKIGEDHLVPIYGVWDSFDEIDFDILPASFVLKCTHGSGTNEVVHSKNEINMTLMKKEFDNWMSKNYAFMCGFEMHYKDIVPRIIAEKYLKTEDGSDLKDYKVHVFNGNAKIVQVDIDRQHIHRRNMYTIEWKYIPVSILYPTAPEVEIERPLCLEELLRLSEVLGEGFIYVRVDWYIVNDKIYFGEMTFTHGSGVEPFDPDSFNLEMGSWMHLPDMKAGDNTV